MAHDPVSEANYVPDELHSEKLNHQLESRWEEFTMSASAMQLTEGNPVWNQLEESMRKFFKYRHQQLYRLARAQMKSGEICEPLEELYQQAAEKALKSLATHQVNLQLMDPMIKSLTDELKKLSAHYEKLNPPAEQRSHAPWFLLAAGLISTVAGMMFYRIKKRASTLHSTQVLASVTSPDTLPQAQPLNPITEFKQSAKAIPTESWMEQLEATLARQQSLEIQQELRTARELVNELKNVIGNIQTAKDPETFYLQLEKLGIVTEAIDNFVAKQDPLRYAEVPYVMTKLILSLSVRIVPENQSNIRLSGENINC